MLSLYTHISSHIYTPSIIILLIQFVLEEKLILSLLIGICTKGLMDPCLFVQIVVKNLALKYLISNKSVTSCYCKMKLKNFSTQISTLPLVSNDSEQVCDQVHATFSLNKSEFEKLQVKSKKLHCLKIEIYSGKREKACGMFSGKLLGTASVDLKGVENRVCVVQDGWVEIGKGMKLGLSVRVEPDPRFVFQFDGKPECSPQVFQVNGNIKQAVFTCKFGFKNSCVSDRNLRSRTSLSESGKSRNWLRSLSSNNEEAPKERKGWSITIHDLSGSPVAAASMVTPFVPSTGTNRVSRSNPGAWLILQPGQSTWKPWGRLEAWLDHGDQLGYRFEHFPNGIDAITLINSTLSTKTGGKFTIDNNPGPSPMSTPSTSFDSGSGYGSDAGSGSWAHLLYRGFVMSSTVTGDGKCSKPEVEVNVNHVTCTEDAAAFVALAAAMNLSIDACSSFSAKLRKELRQPGQD